MRERHLEPPLGERDHVRGHLDALVQLVEFGDFECPFSGQAFPIVRQIEQALGDRLCVGFRHFPLTAHLHALQAAEAVEAAGAQGRFWDMHARLYTNGHALEIPDLIEYAESLGLDSEQFLEDLRTRRHRDKIRADLRSGAVSGVRGTPTFYVNGVRHEGSWGFESLYRALTGAGASREL